MKKYKTVIFKVSEDDCEGFAELTAEEILELRIKYGHAIIIHEKPYWTDAKDIEIEVIIYDGYIE